MTTNSCSSSSSSSSNRRLYSALLALTLAVVTLAATATATATPPPLTLQVATMNAAITRDPLNFGHPASEQRLGQLADALLSEYFDADLVCIQEVWWQDDQAALAAQVAAKFPHIMSAAELGPTPPPSEIQAPCSPGLVAGITQCLAGPCSAASQSGNLLAVAVCLNAACPQVHAESRDSGCLSCVYWELVQIALNTQFQDAQVALGLSLARCSGNAPPVIEPLQRRWNQNTYGLLLLSKVPLENRRVGSFPANFPPRGHLIADVADVRVACTHLVASPGVDNRGVIGPTGHEQVAHLQRILHDMGPHCPHRLLLGDLNAGPALPADGILAEVPATFDFVLSRGFAEVYTSQVALCTWCEGNPLLPANDASNIPTIIDHVLLSSAQATLSQPKRIFDGVGPLPVLSDHYGTQATLHIGVEARCASKGPCASGFQLPDCQYPVNEAQFCLQLAPVVLGPGCWAVAAGEIDIKTDAYWQSRSGGKSIDLNGRIAGTLRSGDLVLPSGDYALSFWLAGNPFRPLLDKSLQVQVQQIELQTDLDSPAASPALVGTLLDQQVTFEQGAVSATAADMQWRRETFNFSLPQGGAVRIVLQSLNSGAYGPAIDDVQLVRQSCT